MSANTGYSFVHTVSCSHGVAYGSDIVNDSLVFMGALQAGLKCPKCSSCLRVIRQWYLRASNFRCEPGCHAGEGTVVKEINKALAELKAEPLNVYVVFLLTRRSTKMMLLLLLLLLLLLSLMC